jgi:hypothetical protein
MKKPKQNKTPEFVIFSEDGFFTGLANGGQPQWSMDIKNGKPFNDECKLNALQNIVLAKELLIEYIIYGYVLNRRIIKTTPSLRFKRY